MEFIRVGEFMQHLFDREAAARQGGLIVAGILAARSPRLSDIAQHMPGRPAANYKAIQRFIGGADLKTAFARGESRYILASPWSLL